MKILLITYQFGGSASGIMSYRVASELVRQRHDVYVVTEHNHISSEQWDGNKCLELRHMFSKRSLYYRIYWHLSSKYRSTGIDYIWCLRAFYKSFCFAKSWKPDWIYCRSSPIHANIIGLFFSKRGYKVLQHFADPIPSIPSFTRGEVSRNYFRAEAIQIISKASLFSMGNDTMMDYEYLITGEDFKNKSFVSPDPAPFESITFRKNIDVGGGNLIKSISYLGEIYASRNPQNLFDAIFNLNQRGIKCELSIYSDFNRQLPSKYSQYVSWKGRQKNVGDIISNSDILVDLDGDDDLSLYISSKLKDYLCSNIPILSITPYNSPANRLLRDLKTVRSVRNNSDEIISAIEYLMFHDFKEDDFQERNIVIRQFTPKSIVDNIIFRCSSLLKS